MWNNDVACHYYREYIPRILRLDRSQVELLETFVQSPDYRQRRHLRRQRMRSQWLTAAGDCARNAELRVRKMRANWLSRLLPTGDACELLATEKRLLLAPDKTVPHRPLIAFSGGPSRPVSSIRLATDAAEVDERSADELIEWSQTIENITEVQPTESIGADRADCQRGDSRDDSDEVKLNDVDDDFYTRR